MRSRLAPGVLLLAAILFGAMVVPYNHHPRPDFDRLPHPEFALVPDLGAQNPAIPNGATIRTGVGSAATASLAGPGTILLSNPGSGLRNYIYQVNCVNTAATATAVTLWDSSATGAAPGVQIVGYITCGLSGATGGNMVYANPIPLRLGSAFGMSTNVTVATAYFSAYGFSAR